MNINGWRDDPYVAPEGVRVRVAKISGKVIERESVRVRKGRLWFVDEQLSSYDYWTPTHWRPDEEGPEQEPPPLAGRWRQRYFWRTELRERAFGGAAVRV